MTNGPLRMALVKQTRHRQNPEAALNCVRDEAADEAAFGHAAVWVRGRVVRGWYDGPVRVISGSVTDVPNNGQGSSAKV